MHLWKRIVILFVSFLIFLVLAAYLFIYFNKERLVAGLQDEINKKLAGEVTADAYKISFWSDFPNISLTMMHAVVKDSAYNKYNLPLLEAENIFLRVDMRKLFSKKIAFTTVTVRDADIHIFKTVSGYMNTAGIVKKKDAAPEDSVKAAPPTIDKIILENTRFHYDDSLLQKHYGVEFKRTETDITRLDSVDNFHINGKLFFNGLAFKPGTGQFLKDADVTMNLQAAWTPKDKTFSIADNVLTIEKEKYAFKGSFVFEDTALLDITIDKEKAIYSKTLPLLNDRIRNLLDGYGFANPLDLSLHISGPMIPLHPPHIDLSFKTQNNTFALPTKQFDNVSFSGSFINHVTDSLLNDEKNSAIKISDFKAEFEAIPFSADILVTDMTNPYLHTTVNSVFDLAKASNSLDNDVLQLTNGACTVQFLFDGLVKEVPAARDKNYMIKGSAKIKNGALKYAPRHLQVKNMDADIVFDETSCNLRSVTLEANNNVFNINGTIERFIDYIFKPQGKLNINASLSSASCDLVQFNRIADKKATTSENSVKHIGKVMNNLLDNIDASLSLNFQKLLYKNFEARNVNAAIDITNDYVYFKSASMQFAGGDFSFSGSTRNLSNNNPYLEIKAFINNADIADVFYAFDNFHQSAITSRNISGTVNTNISFSSLLDKSFNVQPSSMEGKLDISIKDGRLTDLPALTNISDYVFKKRDFSDVEFAELNNSFTLKGDEIQIAKMEVESNVLTMLIEGTYSFAGNTNLIIQVPLSNLKKRGDEYITENEGVDAKRGASIWLKATQENGKLVVKPDLLKKFKKEKNEEPAASDSTEVQKKLFDKKNK